MPLLRYAIPTLFQFLALTNSIDVIFYEYGKGDPESDFVRLRGIY